MDSMKSEYCVGCLSGKEVLVHRVKVQNEVMKSIFQTDVITLCYICKRIAQRVEQFLENVQSNQIFLDTIAQQSTKQVESHITAVINLTQKKLKTIEIESEENVANLNNFCVIDNTSSDKEKTEEDKHEIQISIKEEFKEECNQFTSLDDDFADDSEFPETLVKCEGSEEYYVKQEELDLEDLDLKHLSRVLKRNVKKKQCNKKKPMKTYEPKKKHMKIEDGSSEIEKIYLTKAQCMAERKEKLKDEVYMNSTYKCTDCIKGFSFKASYEAHLLKHSESLGDFMCNICKQRTDTEEKLKSHKKFHEMYKCLVCGIVRHSKLSVKDHYAIEHTDKLCQYSCNMCSKTFKRKKALQQHKIYIHTDRERVTCGYCGKSYATKQVLKAHIINHHPKEVSSPELSRRFVCDECGKAYTAASQLRNHSVKHISRKDYYCVECNKSFKSAANLKHHLKTALPHVKYVELPLSCLHCESKFAIKRDLVRHTNRVHLNIKPYQCDKCDRAYVNGWSLTEHKRLAHEGYKRPLKFPCTMCDKIFDRKQILLSHIRTHTGERPFHCPLCGAQFSQRSILRTHHKLIHLNLTRDGRPKLHRAA